MCLLVGIRVEDIFISCVDGLKGFPEAIEAIFPRTQVQLLSNTYYLLPHTSYIIPLTSYILHHTSYILPNNHPCQANIPPIKLRTLVKPSDSRYC